MRIFPFFGRHIVAIGPRTWELGARRGLRREIIALDGNRTSVLRGLHLGRGVGVAIWSLPKP